MEKSPEKLPESKDKLAEIILSQANKIDFYENENESYKNENDRLKEEIRLLKKALFGSKSEKLPADDSAQLPLFDMPENPPEEDKKEEEFSVIAEHHRKKPGRRPLPESLPRVDLVHDISEAEKVCGRGCQLSKIGEDVTEKLDFNPAKPHFMLKGKELQLKIKQFGIGKLKPKSMLIDDLQKALSIDKTAVQVVEEAAWKNLNQAMRNTAYQKNNRRIGFLSRAISAILPVTTCNRIVGNNNEIPIKLLQ